MDETTHLLIPLPLAELLFVTLGPLSDVLEEEGHRWTMMVKMVLRAYMDGRDDTLGKMYGMNVVKDIDMVTVQVSEELCRWMDEVSIEEEHFEKWQEELGSEE